MGLEEKIRQMEEKAREQEENIKKGELTLMRETAAREVAEEHLAKSIQEKEDLENTLQKMESDISQDEEKKVW